MNEKEFLEIVEKCEKIKKPFSLPSFFKIHRWRWFIADLKFKYTILWLLKKGWFTRSEIGEGRIKIAQKSWMDIWNMK